MKSFRRLGECERYAGHATRETRPDRVVATKVLPESLAQDTDRLMRFQQEARALSALTHPYLLAIFDVVTENGRIISLSHNLHGKYFASESMKVRCRAARRS
jgi:serine/threonine protein kinase